MVTFYSIAGNLCEYARQLVSGMAIIMTPRVSALESRGNEALEGAILGAASVATLTTGAIVATYWFRGESFINLWMGREYGQTSGDLLRILGIVTLFGGARSIAVASIMGVNQHRILVPVWFLEALSNLALSIVLVQFFGLDCLALGTLIPNAIVTVLVLPHACSGARRASRRVRSIGRLGGFLCCRVFPSRWRRRW